MARATVYQRLIDQIAGLSAPDEVKRQFEALVRRNAAIDGDTALERAERVKFARHLLDLREDRPTINRRLMARYGIGRTQAYGVISDALQLSGIPSIFRTDVRSNESMEKREEIE
jgi:hypothetical protein